MEISKEDVFRLPVLSIKEFCESHGGIKAEAIYYAIKLGLVDYIPLGREKFIVLTNHTRQYTPNNHPSRQLRKKKPLVK